MAFPTMASCLLTVPLYAHLTIPFVPTASTANGFDHDDFSILTDICQEQLTINKMTTD